MCLFLAGLAASNPKGWQQVAGGRSQRRPPESRQNAMHPEGVPESRRALWKLWVMTRVETVGLAQFFPPGKTSMKRFSCFQVQRRATVSGVQKLSCAQPIVWYGFGI